MRIYGYKKKDCGNGLQEMREMTISANSDVLRKIAKFILKCADEIDKNSNNWSHEHFAEVEGKNIPDLIVSNPRANS